MKDSIKSSSSWSKQKDGGLLGWYMGSKFELDSVESSFVVKPSW